MRFSEHSQNSGCDIQEAVSGVAENPATQLDIQQLKLQKTMSESKSNIMVFGVKVR